MRVTARDKRLLVALASARWLSTSQVGALCFPNTSKVVPQRRLRLLRQGNFIHSVQANAMAESLHSLGPSGKQALIRLGWRHPIRLERKPPRNLEHFLGINAIRVAVLSGAQRQDFRVDFFYACWELGQENWNFSLLPDAICRLQSGRGKTTMVAFEYDRGEERPGYIVRHKFRRYQEFDGCSIGRVVIVVDSVARQKVLEGYRIRHLPASNLFRFVVRENLMPLFFEHMRIPCENRPLSQRQKSLKMNDFDIAELF